MLSILNCFPTCAAYAPGATALIRVTCAGAGAIPWRGVLRASLCAVDGVVAHTERPVDLAANEVTQMDIPLSLPPEDLRGYGVELELRDATGAVTAQAITALDVCARWERAPRYGFVCDFSPEERDTTERMAAMARYHLNAVQAYDWMYRHYDFVPPTRVFTDALGRPQSLDVAQAKVNAAHQLGMKVLGYAAIYAAQPDFFNAHREMGLFKLDGSPFSLADFLYNTDITNPAWRELMLRECQRAMAALGFDGIHLDQYGYPRLALRLDGTPVDLEAALPNFLNAVRDATGDAPTVFNAVNAWPLEAVSRSRMDPLYIEIWPPNDTLRDVREVILRARGLRGGNPPVIAAYIESLKTGDAGALTALRRLTAAMYLNGGSHIVLGEKDGVLADPYFPKYARLDAASAQMVRRDYDFISRYSEYLFAPDWRDVSATHVGGINEEIRLDAPRFGPNAAPNSIWTIARTRGGQLTLGLVNLVGLMDTAWNAPQPAPPVLREVKVRLQLEAWPQTIYFASPDVDAGRPQKLEIRRDGRVTEVVIPQLDMWGLLIVK